MVNEQFEHDASTSAFGAAGTNTPSSPLEAGTALDKVTGISGVGSAPALGTTPHSSTAVEFASSPKNPFRDRRVWAWGLWDWASAAFNAVVTTFVFSTYLTNAELFGENANALLGYVLAAAGSIVAVVAPALGQSIDRSGKRATLLTTTNLLTALFTALMWFVSPNEGRLWLGLFLIATGNIAFEIGSVIYNAILSDITTKENYGKISGLGWGLGYIGGIVLLLILFVGFINPDTGWFSVTSDNGLNIRASMLVASAWTLVFSLPLMVTLKNKPSRDARENEVGGSPWQRIKISYAEVFASIGRLWRGERSVVWFLIASAIYRDGLAGVFTFGAVLAATAFGFSASEVLIFGVAANLVAGLATIAFGFLDDRIGARRVIIFSVAAMVVFGLAIFAFHNGFGGLDSKQVYWIFGLMLTIFVGPTQSASRTYLARVAPDGEEGELFGLYATTGRAVSFFAPFMYANAIVLGAALVDSNRADAAHFGILGIVVVLLIGLIAFLPVGTTAENT